jgi:two-component system, OmpR family, copper resistance phosphate regulon response regulator CusR
LGYTLKKKILLVDDDADIRVTLSESLRFYFDVETTDNIDFAYNAAIQKKYDLLLLDINLGQSINGIDLCKKIRNHDSAQSLPIVILTGGVHKETLLSSYQVGADDFFDKTEDIDVIAASLDSKIKRVEGFIGKTDSVGNLTLYYESSEIKIENTIYKLSGVEFSILSFFLKNVNRLITRDEIILNIWKEQIVESRVIDTHISNLRKKLFTFDHDFESQYGKGYILRPNRKISPK